MTILQKPLRPNSASATDVANVLHPYTDLVSHAAQGPVIIARGKGVQVWDEDGKDYIEGVAGLWCASLGFDNERLAKAAYDQLRTLPFYHSFGSKSHGPLIDLAERLIALAPVPMARVMFSNSGSEANDTAIKMIWYFNNAMGRPQKKKIIGRLKGYHGVTLAAASLTGLPNNHRSFDLPLPGFVHTMTPHFYHEGLAGENEEDFATRCADELERLILTEGPDTVAGFFAEPVMGAGGVIVPPHGYFEKIQAVLRRYDVLFVADEVICGFGRTGRYWGSQSFGIEPDILVCAKALSASFVPISATIVNTRVYEAIAAESHRIGTFGHGVTYSGHPVAAAVALETLAIYDELDIARHAGDVGAHLQAELHGRFEGHEIVGDVRGLGLIGAVEIVADKTMRRNFDPALKMGARVAKRAEALGVITRALPNDSLAFSPPLIITKAEVTEMLNRFERALGEVTHEARAEGLIVAR